MEMQARGAYELFGLEFNSNIKTIRQKYKLLALTKHPDKCPNDPNASEIFALIQKAYKCLLDFQKNCDSIEAHKNGNSGQNKPTKQPPPNELDLQLTLEEIHFGCIKRVPIVRRLINQTAIETNEKVTLTVNVKRGSIPGIRITIPQQGDKIHGQIPANVVFVVCEEIHEVFKRVRYDLEFTAEITPKQAFKGCKVIVPSIDGKSIEETIKGLITSSTVHTVPGCGLCYFDKANKYGNLKIVFKIIYDLDPEQDPPVEHEIFLTLEQLKLGHIKRLSINRKIINQNETEEYEDKIVTLDIKAGTKVGTRFTFPQQGDQNPGTLAADIIFIVRNKEQLIGEFISEKPSQDPLIEHDMPLSLENILNGCTKKMKISRTCYDADGNETTQDKIVTLDIKPGTPTGTRFTFHKMGNENFDTIPADVVFVTRDKPNLNLHRIGNDIEYTALVTEEDVNRACVLQILTLERAPLSVTVRKGMKSECFPSLGLPFEKDTSKRGNLIVHYKVVGNELKDAPVELSLGLTLEEILYGCDKVKEFERKIIDSNGVEKKDTKTFRIAIKPGTQAGTQFKFPREGNQTVGRIPADVIFTTEDIPHSIFTRDLYNKANICYVTLINEEEAMVGCERDIPTLDKNFVHISIQGIFIRDGDVKRIPNQGLPFCDDVTNRGNLIVRFKVKNQRKESGDTQIELSLTLEDIMYGTVIKHLYNRIRFDPKGNLEMNQKMFSIEIQPGILNGTLFRFPEEGNQTTPGATPNDIVFIVKTIPHPEFKRSGADLVLEVKIANNQAQSGITFVSTFNKQLFKLKIVKPLVNGETRTLFFHGLPCHANKSVRGNLIVIFKIYDDN